MRTAESHSRRAGRQSPVIGVVRQIDAVLVRPVPDEGALRVAEVVNPNILGRGRTGRRPGRRERRSDDTQAAPVTFAEIALQTVHFRIEVTEVTEVRGLRFRQFGADRSGVAHGGDSVQTGWSSCVSIVPGENGRILSCRSKERCELERVDGLRLLS